jgi:hypothetical protein
VRVRVRVRVEAPGHERDICRAMLQRRCFSAAREPEAWGGRAELRERNRQRGEAGAVPLRTAATGGGTGTAARESATCNSVRFQEKRRCRWRRGDGDGGGWGGARRRRGAAALRHRGETWTRRQGTAAAAKETNEKGEVAVNTEGATVEGGCLDLFWGAGQRRCSRGKSLARDGLAQA